MRIGHGYDVHKLVEGRDLILGGVKIVEGDEKNIKITTPMDLKIAELILEESQ